ncbi:MAG: Rrf2 family transcriptional regulator [Defluviitaleaceae bacterium]|nr:Rrf2 family transcriptional regulator [Defluviitaleaceae bacterium]
MRLSSRGCYALAALAEMAIDNAGEPIAVAALALRLQISKIYLEQVFSILKKSGLVVSTKGAQGGYTLAKTPNNITVYDILLPIESALFEGSEKSVENIPPESKLAVTKLVFHPLDKAVEETLKAVTLAELASEVRNKRLSGSMYYI